MCYTVGKYCFVKEESSPQHYPLWTSTISWKKGVKAVLYAYDLMLRCTNKHEPTVQYNMQQGVDILKS